MREITLTDFVPAQARGGRVLDVREPGEYLAGHVPGAELVPMGQVASRLGELPRGVPLYLICATGNRSLAMTAFLIRAGFEAYSVAGGTQAWARAGHPIVRGPRPDAS